IALMDGLVLVLAKFSLETLYPSCKSIFAGEEPSLELRLQNSAILCPLDGIVVPSQLPVERHTVGLVGGLREYLGAHRKRRRILRANFGKNEYLAGSLPPTGSAKLAVQNCSVQLAEETVRR